MSSNVEASTDSIEVVTQEAPQGREEINQAKVEAEKPAEAEVEAQEESQEEVEATESSDSSDENEATDDEEKTSEEESENDGEKKKPLSNIQKLKLKHKRAREEAEYWREQALKGKAQETPQPAQKPQVQEQSQEKPDPDLFDTQEEYFEALADWKADQAIKAFKLEQDQKAARAEFEKAGKDFKSKVDSFREKHDDWDELMEDVSHIPISMAMDQCIVDSDYGPQLMYELAKQPDELERISKLPPIQAAKALGRIEAKIAQSLSQNSSSPEKTKTKSKAPEPISTLGSRSSGAGKKSIYDPTLSQSEYERLRREMTR